MDRLISGKSASDNVLIPRDVYVINFLEVVTMKTRNIHLIQLILYLKFLKKSFS